MYIDTLTTGPVLYLLVLSFSRSFFLPHSDGLTVSLSVSTYQEGYDEQDVVPRVGKKCIHIYIHTHTYIHTHIYTHTHTHTGIWRTLKGKKTPGSPRHRWKDIIKTYLTEIAWSGFVWLRRRTNGWLSGLLQCTSGLHEGKNISWDTKRLSVSRKGFPSMSLFP
jgi:hypothetical protein